MILQLFIKMFACSAILFGYYYFFLRNKRFHHYNRFYLLSISILSLALPWIRIPILLEPDNPTATIVSRSIGIISVNHWQDEGLLDSSGNGAGSWLSWQTVSFAVYLVVTVILLLSLVKSLMYIRKLVRKYVCERVDSLKFYNTTEPGTPFSFFRSIFWNSGVDVDSNDGQKIFKHELFHVKQKHSIDILLMEIVCIFFWINPVFHLIKREIRAIHEFLADQHAIQSESRHDYAELLILQSLRSKRFPIPNYFFQNHIKRRIAMITQFKNKKYGYWSRLLVLPLGILIFCSIALYAHKGRSGANNNQTAASGIGRAAESITVVVDAGHGGNDHGVNNDAGIREKDLALAIAKQMREQAAEHNIKVVLTRERDVALALKDRSEIADVVKASLFVSIHVASAPKGYSSNGFDIFITNRNQQTLSNSRRLGEHIATKINQFYQVGPIKQQQETGIWVLDKVNCPAVLIECGYMTSAKDVAFISEPSNQQRIAKNILQGIVDYLAKPIAINTTDTIPDSIVLNDTVKLTEAQKRRQMAQSKELEVRRAELQKQQKELVEKHLELQAAQQQLDRAKISEKQLQQLDQKQRELEVVQKKMANERLTELNLRENELSLKRKEIELAQQKFAQAGNVLLEKKQELQRLDQKMAEQRLSALKLDQKILLDRNEKMDRQRQEMTEQRLIQIEKDNHKRLQKIEAARLAKLQQEQKEIQQRQDQIELKERRLRDQHQKQIQLEKRENELKILRREKESSANQTDTSPAKPDPLFTKVEVTPAYPGGESAWRQYLSKNFRYPAEGLAKGITGTVVIQFIVEKDGSLNDITAISGPPELVNESIRLIKESGNWLPARQNGVIVKARSQQPIEFRIKK